MRARLRLGTPVTALVAYAVTIVVVFPIAWMVLTAFKDEVSAYQMPPSLTFTPTLSNFYTALNGGFMGFLSHSIVAVGGSTLLALALGTLAAFALVWHPRKSNGRVLLPSPPCCPRSSRGMSISLLSRSLTPMRRPSRCSLPRICRRKGCSGPACRWPSPWLSWFLSCSVGPRSGR